MKELEEFIGLFGGVTVLQVVEFVLAAAFILYLYKQLKKYFDKQNEDRANRVKADELREKKINEALEAVHKYPEYRKQSLAIQQSLEMQISDLKQQMSDVISMQQESDKRIAKMEEDTKRRERNKSRDRLIEMHRYYTKIGSWTRMESEAFWDLFRDYEADGGDGYIHSIVQPDMEKLDIIDPK